MPRKKKETKEEPSKTEVPVEKKKKLIVPKKKENQFLVAPMGSDLWRAFDDMFDSFR